MNRRLFAPSPTFRANLQHDALASIVVFLVALPLCIGITMIFASQFHIMIDDLPKGSGLENIFSLPSAVRKGLVEDDSTPLNHHLAARIGVLTIGTMVLWNLVIPKRFQVMPAVLMGVSAATAVSVGLEIPIERIDVQDNLLSIVHFPALQALSHLLDASIMRV